MICPHCGKRADAGRCAACGGVVPRLQSGLGDAEFVRFVDGQIGDGLSLAGSAKIPAAETGGGSAMVPDIPVGPVNPVGPVSGRLIRILVALDVAAVALLALLMLIMLIFLR